MKTKEIIKKLEAVVCELKGEDDEEHEPEILNKCDKWIPSAYDGDDIRKHTQSYYSDKYQYYVDMKNDWLYRIKK